MTGQSGSQSIPRASILGVGIDAVDMARTLEVIDSWLREGRRNYVCLAPAHSVMACHSDPALRQIFNASGLTTPDGMSIVWILRRRGYHQVDRVYGPDLMLACCEAFLSQSRRHYFYGGEDGVLSALESRLRQRFPGLVVAGSHAPPFRPLTDDEDRQVVTEINRLRADIVWVGIGSPKQERWMAEHLGRLEAPVMIGVGATFDFLAGSKPHAPRWIQRSGLEWLFRLATEPRRLWPRYRRYPLFVLLVLAQELGLRRFPADM
jgi:N-acetylglucosaminyldiphosphoundecaprenol N-acetyl-beta-D-mannosaminyltransferase